MLLVSAHGGNAEPVDRAVGTLRGESRDVLLYQPRWDGDPGYGNHRELHLAVGDVQLVMSEPVASSLREMLAVIVAPASE